jgi:glycolate oxidase
MPSRPIAVDTLLARLSPVFGARLRTDVEALAVAAKDESGYASGDPAAVIFVERKEELVTLAKEASALGVVMVPRGGGTGKAGACIPATGQVVVDFTRMKQILELRPQDLYATVQPGVITGDLHAAVAAKGFFYPPDPGSWESCTLGGNIATNAGGSHAVKYGVTQRYVWGVEAVLASGDVLRVGRKSLKGVAGLDLTSLMVGSEGTLAFIAEATLHIIPAPRAVETAWLTFDNILTASRAAEAIFAAGLAPRMMEVIDKTALDVVRPLAPFRIPEGSGAALLLEMDGDETRTMADLEKAAGVAIEAGATDSALAKNEKEREAMRRSRRLVSSSLKERFPSKISDDIAVPRSRMVEALERAALAGAKSGLQVCAYGHLGDGNLHINILCKSEAERTPARALRREFLSTVVALGGTISGEHGIGLTKRDMLSLEQSAEVIDLQRRLKTVFDPRGLLNPGKVWPDP